MRRLGRTVQSRRALECLVAEANLLAERDTRGLPRVFVDYATSLMTGAGSKADFCSAWDRSPHRDEGAIDGFLKPDLRRQRYSGPVTEPFGTDWISAVYDALCAAARDEPCDESALDRVFEAYRASEHGSGRCSRSTVAFATTCSSGRRYEAIQEGSR